MLILEISYNLLKISSGLQILLLFPKEACAIDALALNKQTPSIVIFNKYLGNNTELFSGLLSDCFDGYGIQFTKDSFISFAENNLGQ